MPRGGQNRKPTALKVVQGTHQPCRDTGTEAVIVGDVDITPPSEFDGVELLIWQKYAQLLKDARILTLADLEQFKNYCQQWGIIEMSMQDIRDNGITLESPTGNQVKNPACSAMKEASTSMRGLAATLGLEPASRSKIDTGKPDTKADGFSDL